MAGRPLEAMALIGIGAENFSITPAGGRPDQGDGPLARRRRRPRSGSTQLLAKPPRDMRKALTDWARRHSVAIG